jgi:hypothetical protein
MNRAALTLMGLLAAVLLVACTQQTGHRKGGQDDPGRISTTEELWEPMASAEGDWLIGQASVERRPGETISNAKTRARLEAWQLVIMRVARESVPDSATFAEHRDDIDRVIIRQPQNFILAEQVVAAEVFRNNTWVGVRVKFKIDRNKVEKALEDMRAIRTDRDQYPIILAIRNNPNLDASELDTLRSIIGTVFNNRGFYAQTFENLRSKILKKRNQMDPRTEEFFRTYLDDPDFKDPSALQGGYTLLAHYASAMIAFNIPVLEITGETVSCVVKAELQDLKAGRTVSFDQEEASRRVPFGGGRKTAIFALVRETSERLSQRLVEQAHDWFDKQERVFADVGKTVTILFKRFGPKDLDAIARIVTST